MTNPGERYGKAVPLLMFVISMAMPVIGMVYFFTVDRSFMVLGMSFVSFIIMAIAAYVYAGNYEVLAGVDMMSEAERSELDLKAVSHTSGIMTYAAASVSFLAMVFVHWNYSHGLSILVWVILFAGILLLMVAELTRKKYRSES